MTTWKPNQPPPGIAASQGLREQMAALSKGKATMTTKELAAGWTQGKIEVSKTEKQGDVAKRVLVGTVAIYVPTLAAIKQAVNECSIDTAATADEKTNPGGLPIYTHADAGIADIANWVQDAMNGKVRIKTTNSLVNGTVDYQAGKEPAMNFAELLEPGERSGEAMKARNECIVALSNYISEQGKSADAVARWKGLFRTPDALASQSASMKDKAKEYLSGFTGTLTPELMARYGSTLTTIESAATSDELEM